MEFWLPLPKQKNHLNGFKCKKSFNKLVIQFSNELNKKSWGSCFHKIRLPKKHVNLLGFLKIFNFRRKETFTALYKPEYFLLRHYHTTYLESFDLP